VHGTSLPAPKFDDWRLRDEKKPWVREFVSLQPFSKQGVFE